jgi:transaldolase / glucose-6-phosphate isomerase
VASFFVSRVDTLVDKRLKGMAQAGELRGKAAIANAKLAYARFGQLFSGPRWENCRAGRSGAAAAVGEHQHEGPVLPGHDLRGRADRAAHGQHDAAADDRGVRDHGNAAVTVTEGLLDARATLQQLEALGIRMDDVTDELLQDGVRLFAEAFDRLENGLGKKVELLRESIA